MVAVSLDQSARKQLYNAFLFIKLQLNLLNHYAITIFCLQTYLLCDEDIGGRKSEKAKELGLAFLYLYF